MKSTFYFIRHGERKDPEGCYDDLTEHGIKEMRDIGNRLRLQSKNSALFTADNYRSKLSGILLTFPDISLERIKDEIMRLSDNNRLCVKDFLNYKSPHNIQSLFKERLRESYEQGRVLKFMTHDSDKIAGSYYRDVSTYKSASEDFTMEVISSYQDPTFQHRVYIGREGLMTSFRARITEITKGYHIMRNYVDWYGENVENDEKCNKITGILTYKPGSGREEYWSWNDHHSRILFNTSHLKEILKR